MLRALFGRRRANRTIRRLLRDDAPFPEPGAPVDLRLRAADIGYVLAAVRGATAEEVSGRMGEVAELAIFHGGLVESLTSGLVVVAFGMVPDDTKGDRAGFVAAVCNRLGADVRIVHGEEPGVFGTVGSPRARLSYTFIVPGFLAALGALAAVEWGSVREMGQLFGSLAGSVLHLRPADGAGGGGGLGRASVIAVRDCRLSSG